jgi:TRAP-type C4-dicarboxylate transport system permease large subunit
VFLVLFTGLATPVEAAAVAVIYAFAIEVMVYRDLSVRLDLPRVLKECGLLVGGILLLVGLAARWVGLLFALEFAVAAFYFKFPVQGWQAGRIDLMLLAGAILLFLAGPGKAAIDEVWLEKGA